MKSDLETLNPTRVKLTVEVPFEELKPSLDAAYKKIAGQVNIPGFRKGRVPPRVIDQRFGRAMVLDEAVNEALPRFYGQAVEENSVKVARPARGRRHRRSTTADKLIFTAEVDVRPEFELPDYSGLEVTVDDAEVTDDEVDEQLDRLRDRFATLTGVERAAADGDFVSIDLSATVDGEAVDDLTAKGLSYQVGQGSLLDGLDEAVDRPVGGGVQGVPDRARRRRPRRQGGAGHGHRAVGQGARAAAARRRLRPDGQRVRHPRRAARRPAYPARRHEEDPAGRAGPRQDARGAAGPGRLPASRGRRQGRDRRAQPLAAAPARRRRHEQGGLPARPRGRRRRSSTPTSTSAPAAR